MGLCISGVSCACPTGIAACACVIISARSGHLFSRVLHLQFQTSVVYPDALPAQHHSHMLTVLLYPHTLPASVVGAKWLLRADIPT